MGYSGETKDTVDTFETKQIEKLESEIKINKIKEYTKVFLMISSFIMIVGAYAFIALDKGIISTDMNIPEKSIAVIDFNKPVTVSYVNMIINKLEDFKKNDNVKEILFIMNCPGGSPSASEELSVYLSNYTKEKKIIMYIEEMSASGGYYIASSVKPLLANKNAIVGSIGVIMNKYSFEEISKKIGVKEDFVTAGKYKVPASLLKSTTEKDREYLSNNLLQPVYRNFLEVVATNRDLNETEMNNLAEGRIFIANTENGLKLVDKITNLYTIKKELKEKYNDTEENPLIFFNAIPKKKKFNLLNIDLDLPSFKTQSSNVLY
jgi:protease-4